jgi:hypothetical protein
MSHAHFGQNLEWGILAAEQEPRPSRSLLAARRRCLPSMRWSEDNCAWPSHARSASRSPFAECPLSTTSTERALSGSLAHGRALPRRVARCTCLMNKGKSVVPPCMHGQSAHARTSSGRSSARWRPEDRLGRGVQGLPGGTGRWRPVQCIAQIYRQNSLTDRSSIVRATNISSIQCTICAKMPHVCAVSKKSCTGQG